MNVEFINPFLNSIINVLTTMAMLEVKPGKPSLKKNAEASGDVTGLIGMTSDRAKGSLAITFSESVIIEVAQRMLGEKPSGIDDTVTDLVGEITNMVCGGAKRELAEKGYDFDLAIPGMIKGKNHSVTHKAKGPAILVPFKTEFGAFYVEVAFE
ncbi:MAG: chemotaxis protein CheX [Gammaproteobacteria bacterium]